MELARRPPAERVGGPVAEIAEQFDRGAPEPVQRLVVIADHGQGGAGRASQSKVDPLLEWIGVLVFVYEHGAEAVHQVRHPPGQNRLQEQPFQHREVHLAGCAQVSDVAVVNLPNGKPGRLVGAGGDVAAQVDLVLDEAVD